MKTIIINNKSTIKAEGNLTSKNCKPVICIDTGEVFTSSKDAAEKAGVHYSAMSACCIGKVKTVKGKRYCYMNRVAESLDDITSRLRNLAELEAKAKAWDALQAKEEAARKAEEDRIAAERKAEAERLAAIEKAEKKIARHQAAYEKFHQEAVEAFLKLREAQRELSQLTGEVEPEVA